MLPSGAEDSRLDIEILSTGDEVASGEIADTNAAEVSRSLSLLGFRVRRHTVVPDDRALIAGAIREIETRADLCVCSGGLGPTEDDLTAEVVADVIGRPLALHEESAARMRAAFAAYGLKFTDNNLRSARLPEGVEVHPNQTGTAPAFSTTIGRCRFFFLPGVPLEFNAFVRSVVIPWIASQPAREAWVTRVLRVLGLPESHAAQRMAEFAARNPSVRIGYRARAPEVLVKLTASAPTREEALARLEGPLKDAEAALGGHVYGRDEDELHRIVHRLLIERGKTLATAESCTGGLLASMITSLGGSSEYFLGGAVTYSNKLKESVLGVPSDVFAIEGAVSERCARAMAEGALERFRSDFAVSITGVAGPAGGTAEKPVGIAYVGLAARGSGCRVFGKVYRGDRDRIRRSAALFALDAVRRLALGLPPHESSRNVGPAGLIPQAARTL